jgi:hypothetical protein
MTRQGTEITTRLRSAIAGTVAALALLAAAAAPDSNAAVPKDFWGVAPQTPIGDADFERMGQGKVGTIRIAAFWGVIDPSSAPGDSSWDTVDPLVRGAAQNGVSVLPFIYGTPDWVAKELDGSKCKPGKCTRLAPKSPEALAAWKTFVGEFLDRYGKNGTFWEEEYATVPKRPVDVIQVWNEQNSSKFFGPKTKPKAYAKVLDATADAVADHDPSVEIVLGGMAELAGASDAETGSVYLEEFYDVKGVKADFDAVAIHPYGRTLPKTAKQIEEFRKVMKQSGDAKAGLWVTELGAGSASGGNPLNLGPKGQADLLTDTFKYFKKKRNKFNIENVTWFSWMDSKVSICDWCKTSGLFKKGLKEKPAWRAFTKFTGGS